MTRSRSSALEAFASVRPAAMRIARVAYFETRQRLPADQPLTARGIAECVASALASAEDRIASERPRVIEQTRRDVACKAGCAMCCHVDVFPTSSEIALIAYALAGGPDAEDARASFARQGQAVVGLDSRARQQRRVACGALQGDRCGVYPVRPGICRGYVSLSRLACEKDWRERFAPKARNRVPTVAEFQMLTTMVVMGLDLWLLERGLEMERVELGAGVAAMLAPAALDAWVAGDRVLRGVPTQHGEGGYAMTLRAAQGEIRGDMNGRTKVLEPAAWGAAGR